jgi:YVTN family beta-propeller protein
VFEPSTKTVWVFNGRSNNVTVLDAATNKVVSTLEVPGKPEFPVADGRGSVYDNIESRNELVRFDARTRKITATWPLTNCESPSGLAMDSQHRRLFAVCDGDKMAVVDADSGKQLASPEIGGSPDAANFSSTRQLAFSSNGAGTLTIIDAADNYRVIQNLPTAIGARTMSYDDLTDRAFLVTAQLGPAPAPTKENAHPRPTIVPETLEVLEVGRKK